MFFSSTFQINFSLALQLARDSVTLMEQLLIHRESYTGDIDPTRINHQMTQVKKAGELNNFFNAETIAFLGSSGEGRRRFVGFICFSAELMASRKKQRDQLAPRFPKTCYSGEPLFL